MSTQKKPRKPRPFRLTPPEPLESQVQKQIGDFLDWCPDVPLWWRQNVAAGQLVKEDGTLTQWMRFGFVGCPDILGYLRDGTMLMIEVKKPSVKKARTEQQNCIEQAQRYGVLALIARDYSDVKRALDIHFGRISA